MGVVHIAEGNKMKELYKNLEVSEDSSEEEIKDAFRKKAKETHPDLGGDQNKFREIQLSYETLIDPRKRKQYDEGADPEKLEEMNQDVTLQMVVGLFTQAIQQKPDFDLCDIVKAVDKTLKDEYDSFRSKMNTERNAIVDINKFLKRLRGPDTLKEMMKNNILMHERQIKTLEEDREKILKARAFVAEYSYEVDAPSDGSFKGSYGSGTMRGW